MWSSTYVCSVCCFLNFLLLSSRTKLVSNAYHIYFCCSNISMAILAGRVAKRFLSRIEYEYLSYTGTHTHALTHTHTHTRTLACTPTHSHAHTHGHSHAHPHTRMHTHTHHTHARTHTHTHTTRMHTHTHTFCCMIFFNPYLWCFSSATVQSSSKINSKIQGYNLLQWRYDIFSLWYWIFW